MTFAKNGRAVQSNLAVSGLLYSVGLVLHVTGAEKESETHENQNIRVKVISPEDCRAYIWPRTHCV